MHLLLPVLAGIAVGILLIAAFSIEYEKRKSLELMGDTNDDFYVNVLIPLGAYDATLDREFNPQKTRTVLYEGENCCGFVRWVNNDILSFRLIADTDSDPAFFNATRNLVIRPGASFEYAFTKPGEYRYHGQQGQTGVVEVLSDNSKSP